MPQVGGGARLLRRGIRKRARRCRQRRDDAPAGRPSRALPEAATVLDVLPGATVFAFAGDRRGGAVVARFPRHWRPPCVQQSASASRACTSPSSLSSAACGSDLILIEAALEIGAEVNVVLPFDRDDFVRTSVAPGGSEWIGRFEAALAGVSRVIMATDEGYLDDDVLFDYAALLLEGLAVLRASQLEMTPTLLCVLDADSKGGLGGTHASFERWRRHFEAPQTIDLRELRERHLGATMPPAHTPSAPAAAAATMAPAVPLATGADAQTLLFADFAG
jgi:hypothetical protein